MARKFRAVYLHKTEAERLRPLFPNLLPGFICDVDSITELPFGMEVIARPMGMNRSTNKAQEIEGKLMIPWTMVDFWFEYSSEEDESVSNGDTQIHRRLPMGFHVPQFKPGDAEQP